jgi:hypothetical protein
MERLREDIDRRINLHSLSLHFPKDTYPLSQFRRLAEIILVVTTDLLCAANWTIVLFWLFLFR